MQAACRKHWPVSPYCPSGCFGPHPLAAMTGTSAVDTTIRRQTFITGIPPRALSDCVLPRTARQQRGEPSCAAHHVCGLSRDVTTKSVRSLPQLEQRNLRRVSGTVFLALVDQGLQVGVCLMLAAALAPDQQRDRLPLPRRARVAVVCGDDPGHCPNSFAPNS